MVSNGKCCYCSYEKMQFFVKVHMKKCITAIILCWLHFFKVYMADMGLLRRKSGLSHKTILEESELYHNFKGALTENFVLNELLAQGRHPYFWRSGNTAELDFIFENEDRVIPIEAKANISTRAKSYLQFCRKYRPSLGFKFSKSRNVLGEHKGM